MTQGDYEEEFTSMPPPPRRTLLPEQSWGATSRYTPNFSAGEIIEA
jgi:hypothetical protein